METRELRPAPAVGDQPPSWGDQLVTLLSFLPRAPDDERSPFRSYLDKNPPAHLGAPIERDAKWQPIWKRVEEAQEEFRRNPTSTPTPPVRSVPRVPRQWYTPAWLGEGEPL